MLQRYPTRDLDRKFHLENAAIAFCNFHRLVTSYYPVGRTVLRNKFSDWSVLRSSIRPSGVIISVFRPSFMFKPCVIVFSKEDLVAEYRAFFRLPCRIRSYHFLCTVFILYLQLSHEARRSISHQRPALHRIEESVSKHCPDSIGSILQHFGQVICQVHDQIFFKRIFYRDVTGIQFRSGMIIRLVRRQIILSHSLSVDIKFKISETGTVEKGFPDFFLQGEFLSQNRSGKHIRRFHHIIRFLSLPWCTDPLSFPSVLRQNTHVPAGRLAPLRCLSVLIPHFHLPPVSRARA